MLREYAGRGFPLLERFCEALKTEYEPQRARYPALREFYPKLQALFEAASGAPPSEEETRRAARARQAKDKAVKSFGAGDVRGAAGVLEQARSEFPKDIEVLLDLGVVYEKLGRGPEAMSAYSQAVALGLEDQPRSWELTSAALSSRATLLLAGRRSEEAARDLKKALELAPAGWSGRAELRRRLEALK
jgi:Flp pilus assembly protein TadD